MNVRYWQSLAANDLNDGDKYALLYALNEMGVLGVFSDWPATVTFFGNCLNIGTGGGEDEPTPPAPTPGGKSGKGTKGSKRVRV